MSSSELSDLLAPLIGYVQEPSVLQLVAHAERVTLHHTLLGSHACDVAWTPQMHADALRACQQPQMPSPGVVAYALGTALVVGSRAGLAHRLETLCEAHFLSALAARLLSTTLDVGRNILVVGPWERAVGLLVALGAEGQAPLLYSHGSSATPPGFLHARRLRDARRLAPDRLIAWSLSPSQMVRTFTSGCGVAAHLEARRIDRALMRFELAATTYGHGKTPLHVLAGLDLVVVVQAHGTPAVTEIAEIVLAEEGYRPKLLFVAGLAPAPHILQPLAPPSYLQDLAQHGHGALADELCYVGHVADADLQPARPRPPATVPTREAALPPPATPRRSEPAPQRPLDFAGATQGSPGWELDLPSAADLLATHAPTTHSEDATMAALHGLAPPPRPRGAPPTPATRDVYAEVTRIAPPPPSIDDEP